MGEVHPFPHKKKMGLPWLLALLSLCFFGAAAGQLTSEDQRVDGWLLQKIISLQTDCFIDFFSAKIFPPQGFDNTNPSFHDFYRWNFSGEKKQPCRFELFQKKHPSAPLVVWVAGGFGIQIGRYPLYRCFQKQWYPQIIHFNRVFPYNKSSILGYLYFLETPIYLRIPFISFCFFKAMILLILPR